MDREANPDLNGAISMRMLVALVWEAVILRSDQ
jgi:hypothetical protein